MGKRHLWVTISIVATVLSLIIIPLRGIRLGIEFMGGTEVQIRYAQAPDLGAIRSTLKDAGLEGGLVTTIGDPKDNEVYIRLAAGGTEKQEAGLTTRAVDALHAAAVGDAGKKKEGDLN